jgi:hypothetical protein
MLEDVNLILKHMQTATPTTAAVWRDPAAQDLEVADLEPGDRASGDTTAWSQTVN